MDKKYQDIHLRDIRSKESCVIRKVMIERIDFTDNCMIVVAKDDINRNVLIPIPKLRDYELIIN